MNPVKRGVSVLSLIPRARAYSASDETERMKTAWNFQVHVRCASEDHQGLKIEVRVWEWERPYKMVEMEMGEGGRVYADGSTGADPTGVNWLAVAIPPLPRSP